VKVTCVAISEAKRQFSELVRRAEAGEQIVITRYGLPVVRLVALDKPQAND
jgi:prevent-host-death family protein